MLHKGWCGMFLSGMVGTASGGSEKKYKITDTVGLGLPETALAGEYIVTTMTSSFTVTRADGRIIPSGAIAVLLDGEKMPTVLKDGQCFVMPAEDVTIS